MKKNRLATRILSLLILGLFISLFCHGCGPSYPKEKLPDSLAAVCKKEYKIDVQVKLIGKMIVVFIPLEELFDSKLDIVPEAIEKIENVIITTSRVIFSTDAKVDFYMIIAADIKTTAAELVLIRYLDDVYKLMNGWIKREDYHKRVLWRMDFNPKLLQQPEFEFDMEEMTLPVFLAEQIGQRSTTLLDSSVVYKLKVQSSYQKQNRQFIFSVIVAEPYRFKKIYGPIILRQAYELFKDYKFEDFDSVTIKNELLKNSIDVSREQLKEYQNVNYDELLTLPFYGPEYLKKE